MSSTSVNILALVPPSQQGSASQVPRASCDRLAEHVGCNVDVYIRPIIDCDRPRRAGDKNKAADPLLRLSRQATTGPATAACVIARTGDRRSTGSVVANNNCKRRKGEKIGKGEGGEKGKPGVAQ